jgi:hypothetical protein
MVEFITKEQMAALYPNPRRRSQLHGWKGRILICPDCRHDFSPTAKNQKYCEHCRTVHARFDMHKDAQRLAVRLEIMDQTAAWRISIVKRALAGENKRKLCAETLVPINILYSWIKLWRRQAGRFKETLAKVDEL